jgi:hypothetical protein
VCVSASVYSGADQSGKDLNDFINDDDDGENEGHGRSSLQQSQIVCAQPTRIPESTFTAQASFFLVRARECIYVYTLVGACMTAILLFMCIPARFQHACAFMYACACRMICMRHV